MLPWIVDCVHVLQKCRKDKNVSYAKLLYAHICNNGLEAHGALGNYFVPMLVQCGSLLHADQAFHKLVYRNQHSWNSLMLGYIQSGLPHHALILYHNMQEDGVHPSKCTFLALLKACSRFKDAELGLKIHFDIQQKRFHTDLFVGSTLIDMYAKCGALSKAQEVFDQLPARNVVSWNSLIAGYAEHGSGWDAVSSFDQLQMEGISPNDVTYVLILKACANIGAIDKGREIHKEIILKQFEKGHLFVSNALINMYAKCGSLSEAWKAFEDLPVRDVVSWNSLITGYAEHGPAMEALKCFDQMQLEGISPNDVTFVCILKACGSIGAIDKGRQMHMLMIDKGFEKENPSVGNTLIDMYVKCGSLSEAQEVFDNLPVRDAVSWTALIAGYAEQGYGQEALKYFEEMQLEGVSPNGVTYLCILKACGSIGAIEKGRAVHMKIAQKEFKIERLLLGSMLIDMYAKCGSISEASNVFDSLPVRDVILWNAMINGYGLNHKSDMAIKCFEDMEKQGVKPDASTFTCLLNACSHTGLVFKGQEYLKLMREEYGILLTIDHCTCMVDLLARSGHLYEAEKFIEAMPCHPSVETWTALLSGCKTHGQVEIGLRCFQHLAGIDPKDASSYILMESMCVSTGRRDDASKIEELRKFAGAKKKLASALIEVNMKVHEFVVGESQSEEISAMLELLSLHLKEEGNIPNLALVMKLVSDEQKEAALCEHAEKIAMAFGLLNTQQGQTLRITKNMRMCNNCHEVSKIISNIERREIIVRNSYCAHHFKGGACCCENAH